MNDNYEYECALSGITSSGGISSDVDGLADLPEGWIEVKMTRRGYNPKWIAIQQVKNLMVEALVGQIPEAHRDAQRLSISLQIEAQFHGLEKETPIYFTDVERVFLASPSEEEGVLEAINQVRELLGLEVLSEEKEEEDEGDKDESVEKGERE